MSFIRVFLFWWVLSVIVFGFMEPEDSLAIAAALARSFGFSAEALPEKIHVLNSWQVQLWVLYRWTAPLVLLGVGAFTCGLFWARRRYNQVLADRAYRETGKGEFRGMRISMDFLPVPTVLPRLPLSLSGPNASKILGSMTEVQRALFIEVLESLHAHPRAFVGNGHFGTLLEHSLNVVERLIGKADEHCAIAFVAAAAHDLGKIEAWVETDLPVPPPEPAWLQVLRNRVSIKALTPVWNFISKQVTPPTPLPAEGSARSWKQLSKVHDQLSAQMVTRLPSYMRLPQHEQDALYFALAYDHNRNAMPALPTEKADRLARKMMSLVQEADSKATREEKAKVLETVPVEAQVIRSFRDALPGLQFQSGVAIGAKKQITAGFHLGNGLAIFFENQLREKCMERLPPETRAALGGEYRDQGRLADFSAVLIKEFHKLGWLVTEWDKWEGSDSIKPDARLWNKVKTGEKWKLPVTEAVWNVISNIYTYNCMIIVQLPEDMMSYLPPKTKFTIVVKEPHFRNMRGRQLVESSVPDQASIIKSAGLLDGLLKQAPAKPVVPPSTDPLATATAKAPMASSSLAATATPAAPPTPPIHHPVVPTAGLLSTAPPKPAPVVEIPGLLGPAPKPTPAVQPAIEPKPPISTTSGPAAIVPEPSSTPKAPPKYVPPTSTKADPLASLFSTPKPPPTEP